MEIAIYIAVGIILGLVIGILAVKGQKSAVEAKAASLTADNERLSADNEQLKASLGRSNEELQSLSTRYEVLMAKKENVEQKIKEELQKAEKDKSDIQQFYQSHLKEANRVYDQKCEDMKYSLDSQQKQMQESFNRELEAKTAEHNKSMETLKEHHAKETATLKSSFEESRANWQSERQTILDDKQQALAAKDEECRNAIAAQEKRHNDAVGSMKAAFTQTIENLKADMKAATEDILKNRQQEFSDLSQKNIKGIVDPLNETIEKMKQAMEGYSKEQSEFSGTMKTNLDTIIKQTETARQSAVELTTALKHDTKVQGDYGEAILDEILSKQGFTEGVHYELQYVMKDESGRALKDEDGAGLRPDVIFHIDTVRDVIIDSKMNLTEFILFANAQTPEERKEHLEKHVKAIETQVKLLSQKNYFKHHKKTSSRMDYVIMFVPISAAWWEALRYKPSLWREAMDSNVYIADEQTLFAALRIIKLTWTQIAQVNSQKEIFELVNEMIDRVGQFMKSYKTIGDALEKAQKAYSDGEAKLTPGGYSILTTTAKLIKKGGQDSKRNPVGKFLDVDDVEQLPDPVGIHELPEEVSKINENYDEQSISEEG